MPRESHEIYRRFGMVLRARRKAAGMSQTELAVRAGLSSSFVSRMENGLRGPTVETVVELANALGMSASDLMREVERSR